ncbi:MAG: nuclear transport factor 2 family protein [Pseudomonadota bacterium]
MTHQDTIRDYFRCYKDRDRSRLVEILTEDLVHSGPFGRYENRDKMLDEIWPHVGPIWAVDVEVFGDGPGYMVRYRHEGASAGRLSEYMRFDGDRIAEIEVYHGAGAIPGLPGAA